MLGHVLVLGKKHMKSILNEFALSYFNHARPHQGTEQQVPGRQTPLPPRTAVNVIGIPVLGGLHHDYWRAA